MDMSSNTRLRNKSDVDSTAVIATWMRRCGLPLAILIVYLLVLGALIALLYLIVSTAISQFVSLSAYVRFMLTPEKGGQVSQLEQTLKSLGLSQSQIASARSSSPLHSSS